MRTLRILLLAILIAVPVAVAAAFIAFWMCFQNEPLVVQDADITPDTIERAKRILEAHDPRKARAGELRTIAISQADLDIVINYALRKAWKGSAHVVLQPGAARVQASLEPPGNPLGRWVNFDANLRETGGLPAVDQLRVGTLHVPGFLADIGLAKLVSHLTSTTEGRLAQDVVKSVNISAENLRIAYQWREDIQDRARAIAIPPDDLERFRAYSDCLVDAVSQVNRPRSVSVAPILSALFTLARERSVARDPAKENRAAIVTLAMFADGRNLSTIIPAANGWRKPPPITLTLNGRDDFPKHFLISAAIAVEAGTPLANAIGLHKEVEDSRGGSGFSFNDIAADRAGTRFGEFSVKMPRKLQQVLSRGVSERDFMPDVSDLPEFIPEAEFKQRYGGIGSPAYARVMADIEQRVGAIPLFR